jgi:hypothetical protein
MASFNAIFGYHSICLTAFFFPLFLRMLGIQNQPPLVPPGSEESKMPINYLTAAVNFIG